METAQFFKRDFEENGSMERVTLFLNLVKFDFAIFLVNLLLECANQIFEVVVVFNIFDPSNTKKAYHET